MNKRRTHTPCTGEGQRGQILILFTFAIVALLLCILVVVDVAFFLHTRERVQAAADAAALAGAQELPDDPASAGQIALDYIEKHGFDSEDVTITFSCTSDSDAICQDGDGRYDTIRVTSKGTAPAIFGGVLRLVGGEGSCWVDGCTVDATAAACRGACGPVGTGPVDVVMALDHSYSMTTSDLVNAKNAIRQLITNFDFNYHRVGLAVTPPVNSPPGNMCDSVDSWFGPLWWLPANLTNTFQSSPHALNSYAPPVSYTSCMDRTDFRYWDGGELTDYPMYYPAHTDLGSPLKAATDELAANGRPDVVHGIILLTDGAANVAPFEAVTTTSDAPGDTGWHTCDVTAAVTSGSGDNNGFQSNATAACSDGGSYASDKNSGNGTSTSCTSPNKDRHVFYDYDLDDDIPSGAVINGIEVRLDAWANGSGTRRMCVELSSDGGSSWTSPVQTDIGTSQQTFYLGGPTDLWGRSWTDGDFSPSSDFRVRITNVGSSTSTDFRLDYIAAKLHYTATSTSTTYQYAGNLGPCDWAAQQAAAAKAQGIELFIIGFGVSATERCNLGELSSSPYYNMLAADFLRSLATDDAHFYNEPKNEDLEPIFQAIGAQLTGGSRLIE